MSRSELSSILGRCLEAMRAGDTLAACLARYPEHAAELEPLLTMAGDLDALGGYELSSAARLRAKARLRQATHREVRPPLWAWLRPGGLLAPRAAVGLAIFMLCLLLTSGVVAASQPGDLVYGLRVAVERVPALLASDAQARARAEMGIATRRLGDLDRVMRSQEQDLDGRTLTALLTSVEEAAKLAGSLPPAEQAAMAARLLSQAEVLAQMGQSARQAQHAAALQDAAARAHRAAERTWAGTRSAEPSPSGPAYQPTVESVASPHSDPTPALTPAATIAAPTPAGSAEPRRATPEDAGQQRKMPRAQPAATPQVNTRPTTTPGPGPAATHRAPAPILPGPKATVSNPGSTVTPPGPGATSTSPGSDPGPNSLKPEPGTTPASTPVLRNK